jgi:hypothetical protein
MLDATYFLSSALMGTIKERFWKEFLHIENLASQ